MAIGASCGIGRATAARTFVEGPKVTIAGRSEEELCAARASLTTGSVVYGLLV